MATVLGLAASVLVLAWPHISLMVRDAPGSYALVTLAFTTLMVTVAATRPLALSVHEIGVEKHQE